MPEDEDVIYVYNKAWIGRGEILVTDDLTKGLNPGGDLGSLTGTELNMVTNS